MNLYMIERSEPRIETLCEFEADQQAAADLLNTYCRRITFALWEGFWKEVLQAMTDGHPMEGGHGSENVILH